MAAPIFVGAGPGVIIQTGSAAVAITGVAHAVGDLFIVQILQDGSGGWGGLTGAGDVNNLFGLALTNANSARIFYPVGSSVGSQHLILGRISGASPAFTVTTLADDLYCRAYVFRNVNTGVQADVFENGTAGTVVNATGATAAITDVAVTTLGADRLALNFVAVDDDNPLAVFTGATGGTWQEAVAEFASATGTDGAIQLQLGSIAAVVQQPGNGLDSNLGNATTTAARAIKFTAPATGTIALCQVNLKATGAPTDDLIVEIQTNSGGNLPSGTVIGAPVTLNVTSTTLAAYTADVAAAVTSGTVYWIVIRRTGAIDAVNYYDLEWADFGSDSAQHTSGAWTTSVQDFAHTIVVPTGAAGTIDGGTQTMAAADNWGVIGFALKPLPSGPATLFGATASPYTFAKAVAGQKQTYGATDRPYTFAAQVAGQVSVPAVTHYGALAAPWAFGAAVAGQRKAFGATANPYTFSKAVAGQRKTFGATATPLTFARAVAATKKTFGQTAAPFTFGAVVAGIASTGAVTHYGALTAPFTFGENTQATRKTYGATANPYAFAAVTQARRRTTSSIAAPFVFAATHAAQRKAFGAITAPFVFGETTQGRRRTTSSLVAPFTFTKAVQAQRRTTGQLAAPFAFGAVTASRKQYARLTAPFVFGAAIQSSKKTYGVVARPITFGAVTAGIGFTGAATHFGATTVSITFGKAVQGSKRTFGVVARPITFGAVVQGRRTTKAQVAAVYTWSSTTQAKRKTHATVAMPIQWLAVTRGVSTVGIQTYYGVVARPITFAATTVGRRRTTTTITMPITMSAFTKGMLMASILNYADDIRWGSIQADRVMVGTEEVWTP